MAEFVVGAALIVLGLAYVYGTGEACCWPDKDPFRRIRYWFGDADYVHSEDVPWGYGFDGPAGVPRRCRRLFAAHRRSRRRVGLPPTPPDATELPSTKETS